MTREKYAYGKTFYTVDDILFDSLVGEKTYKRIDNLLTTIGRQTLDKVGREGENTEHQKLFDLKKGLDNVQINLSKTQEELDSFDKEIKEICDKEIKAKCTLNGKIDYNSLIELKKNAPTGSNLANYIDLVEKKILQLRQLDEAEQKITYHGKAILELGMGGSTPTKKTTGIRTTYSNPMHDATAKTPQVGMGTPIPPITQTTAPNPKPAPRLKSFFDGLIEGFQKSEGKMAFIKKYLLDEGFQTGVRSETEKTVDVFNLTYSTDKAKLAETQLKKAEEQFKKAEEKHRKAKEAFERKKPVKINSKKDSENLVKEETEKSKNLTKTKNKKESKRKAFSSAKTKMEIAQNRAERIKQTLMSKRLIVEGIPLEGASTLPPKAKSFQAGTTTIQRF